MKTVFTLKNFVLLTLLFMGACAGHHIIENFQGSSMAQSPGVITIRTGWLKDKRKTYDTELWFINESKNALVVPVDKISCTQGKTLGSFRIVGYDTRKLELEAGEQRRFTTICYIGEKLDGGPYILNFRDISARRTDGSSGKILAASLTLNLVPTAKN